MEWTDPAGEARLVIERMPSGHCQFYEERLVVVDETAEGGGIYEYWRPGPFSGLYPSLPDARNDAANTLAWFRAVLDTLNPPPPVRP